MPTEAARGKDVRALTCRRRVDHHSVVSRIYHQQERGIRNGRSDQPGAGFVDCESKIGDGIEIEVLERPDGRHQGAQHRQVLQLGGDPELDRPPAAQLPVVRVRVVGHVTSRQFPRDTTPGRIPASHRRSDDLW